MTRTGAAIFDEELARRADAIGHEAIELLLDSAPVIAADGQGYQVVVVAAPAGAGKSEFVCEVAQHAVDRYRQGPAVVVVATPTNDQAYELVRRIALRLRTHDVAFVPAQGKNLPPATAALPNVHEVRAADADHYPIVVGTLDKLGDAHARGDLAPSFRFLVIDEAYQAHSAHYFGVAGLASRHLLVGDPGQLDPFTTMDDPDRWRGLPEDPTQTAVAVVCTNHPAVPILRLPITRRLPPSAVPLVQAFYPGHPFSSWTLPGCRSLTLMSAVAGGRMGRLDRALDLAATSGWAYIRLPDSPVLTADPATVEVLAQTASRLIDRGPRLRHERGNGSATVLQPERVAVAVSHNDQKDHVRVALDRLGHRHACVVVGRTGDADLLESVPPPADAWLGHEGSPEVDGWFSHRVVFEQLGPVAVDTK